MILTSSILLLATLGAVEPYQQFLLNGPPSGYNSIPALTNQQTQQPILQQPQSQQSFHPTPGNIIQMNANAQRFYMQPYQVRNQGFSPLQNQIQQNQQRQIPFEVKTQSQALQRPQQSNQFSYFGLQQQPQMRLPLLPPPSLPQQVALSPAPIPFNKQDAVSVQPPPVDKDNFLSSLQIIDNNGELRNLKEFGLEGTGDQPANAELEKSLRTIFETINRDLEHAEFLPLAMNGAQNQNQNMFFQPQNQVQNAQSTQRRPINIGSRGQPAQIEQQGQQPQQALGYAFQQPKQSQFQFLKPLRASKINQTPEQAIRSPAQALRSSKQQLNQNRNEQRPIENLPIQQQQENLDLPPVQKQQNDFEDNTQTIGKATVGETKGRRQQPNFVPQTPTQQQPRQEIFIPAQEPIVRPKIQAPLPEQKSVQSPMQEQQQSNLGFDDEPVELKAVERAPVQQSVKSRPKQDQQSNKSRKEIAPVAKTIEPTSFKQGFEQEQQQSEDERTKQTKFQVQPPRRPFQQQSYEEEKLTDASPIKSNVKKFEGWTPIVNRPKIYEQQRVEPQQQQQQQFFEQQKDDQGFDDQKPVFQDKDSSDQPKQEPELLKDDFPVQQQEVQTSVNQQSLATKGGGSRLVKLRKSINKFAASAKSKLSGSTDSGLSQYQTGQQNIQQEKATQQQEQQIFDTLSNLQDANLEQKEQLSQEIPQQPKVQQQQELRSQDQPRLISLPPSTAGGIPRIQAQRQSIKSTGRQTPSKIVGPIKATAQQIEQSRQTQQQQEEVQAQQQQQEELLQQQKQQDNEQPQTQQQTQILQQQDEYSQSGLQQQPRQEAIFPQQQEEQLNQQKLSQQQQQQQQQQQKMDEEPLQQQKQDDFIPQQKQAPSQQKQEEFFSQQKQEELIPQQKQEEQLSQQKQDDFAPQQKQEEQLSQQKQDDFAPQQRQEEQLSQQKQDDFVPQQRQEEQLSQQKQEEAPAQQQPGQQKEDSAQEQRVQQAELVQIQEQQKPQKQSEQQEQQLDEPIQQLLQQQQSLQQKEPVDEPISTTTTTTTTSRPRQATKGKRRGQQKTEDKSTGRGKTIRPQRPLSFDGEKQQQKLSQQQQQENEGQNQQLEEANTQTKIEDELSTTSTTTSTPRQTSKSLVEDQRTVSKGRLPIQKARQQQLAEQVEEKQQSIDQDRQEVQIQQQKQPQQQIEDDSAQQQGVKQQEEFGLTQVNTQDDSFTTATTTTTTTTTFRPRLQQSKRLRQEIYQAEKKAPIGQQERGQRAQNQRAQLSAHQLLNTYNPLQFEPERISSLTRASQSSSQDTNVNSSPSAESY